MNDPSSVLSYAVRVRVILKYLGQIAFVVAILSLVPLVAALILGDWSGLLYVPVIGVLLIVAAPAARLPTPAYVQANEALTIIALAFLIAAGVLSVPLMGSGLDAGEALFESVSAITTTGLTTLSSVENHPPAFLFARAWFQWCGGLGFVVLLVALLMGSEMAARRLAEPYGSETLLTTTRTHARRMLGVYLALTGTGLLAVWLAVGDGFTAVVHVLSGVSTGGFSSLDQSLAGMDSWVARFTVIAVSLLGAIPLYFRGVRANPLRDIELRTLVFAVLGVAAAITLLLHFQSGAEWGDATRHGLLMGVSAQTTTGYSTMDVTQGGSAAMLVLILAMFVGGGLGSTAGGIKLLRALVLLRLVQLAIRRTMLAPHAVGGEARLGERKITENDIQQTLLLLALYVSATLVSWLAFLLHGYPALESLFEVVSAIGTVGLSTGITRPDLEPLLKVLLSIDMLLGRLEMVAFLVLLYPRNWFGRRVD
jgi:trk system potassium uptake protein TrkH